MPSIEELKEQYQELNDTFDMSPVESIKSELLMAFEYEYPGSSTEVSIDTDEFTAVCPWPGPRTGSNRRVSQYSSYIEL